MAQRVLVPSLAFLWLVGCSSSNPLPHESFLVFGGTGGVGGSSGTSATGGLTTGGGTTGGLGATGGSYPSGGSLPTGGTVPAGGTGSVVSTGGAMPIGGATGSTGGTTGGAPPTGGSGGVAPTGGTPPTGGGTPPIGGSGGSGGTPPTGGNETGGAPPSPYGNGYAPVTVTVDDARAAYEAWKDIHLEDCGSGVHRVRWENAKLDATVSEGIGYGMLLAVSWNDQTVFDGLYAYSRQMANKSGPGVSNNHLMDWLRYGCDAHKDTKYSEYPDGAAADADLDVAMALIMANCRWGGGNYSSNATNIINAIREHMFWEADGLRILQPGDSSWFDDTMTGMPTGCVNYSYFAPAYYRAFAEHVPADAAFWNAAASDAYTLLGRASHSTTGLVRNWGSADGNDAVGSCSSSYTRAASYGDDAARTPWRIGTDYLWYGTTAAKSWTDRVTTWVKGIPISQTGQWYHRDGTIDSEAPSPTDHTVINVGPFAVGAMSYDQATVDDFAAEILAIPAVSSAHDGEYFPRMLRALSLLALSGGFTACGGG
ncbi:MAG: hypothetical protein JW751_06820 [Polyangiaceae bacterium]|nr:hypothetical protein [Polyangiaceae bacterium]